MFKYPVFVIAQNEDGSRESFHLTVISATPEDALEQAIQQYLPRYREQEGWRIVAAVDELRATALP